MKQKYDIFISYRRKDAGDKAEHLKDLLEPFFQHRISFDRENLSGKFNSQLIQRIDHVKDFLLVLGKDSLCYSANDGTPELVSLYHELAVLSDEDFAKKIIDIENQIPIDYVRIEIGRALRRKDLHIIPVVPERSTEYNFASLYLPDDISQIKGFEAVFYSDSPDALFKDVLPKVRKHLKSKTDLIINKSILAVIFSLLIIVIGLGSYIYLNNTHRAKIELQRRDLISNLQERYKSFGLNFYGNDTITIAELSTIEELLDDMQEIIPDSLMMGMFEVTVDQWARIMKQPYIPEDSLIPKTNVSLGDCLNFTSKLYDLTNIYFDLPTEEEWVYAAKGGENDSKTIYAGSNDIDSVAWYMGNSKGKKHKCDGALFPNQFNLFNMSGNVSEICNSNYYIDASEDKKLSYITIRGGNYASKAHEVAIESRSPLEINDRNNDKVGFRLVIRKQE